MRVHSRPASRYSMKLPLRNAHSGLNQRPLAGEPVSQTATQPFGLEQNEPPYNSNL